MEYHDFLEISYTNRVLLREILRNKAKETRKEIFFGEMDRIIPWQEMSDAVKPHYPAPNDVSRRPVEIKHMLRIQFLQHWFELSDSSVEEALYDFRAMRQFVGIDLCEEPVPDENIHTSVSPPS